MGTKKITFPISFVLNFIFIFSAYAQGGEPSQMPDYNGNETRRMIVNRKFGVGQQFECDPFTYSEYGREIYFQKNNLVTIRTFSFSGGYEITTFFDTGYYDFSPPYGVRIHLTKSRYLKQSILEFDTMRPDSWGEKMKTETDSLIKIDTSFIAVFGFCLNHRVKMKCRYFEWGAGESYIVRYPKEYLFQDTATDERITLDFDAHRCYYMNSKGINVPCQILSNSDFKTVIKMTLSGDSRIYTLLLQKDLTSLLVRSTDQPEQQFQLVSKPVE